MIFFLLFWLTIGYVFWICLDAAIKVVAEDRAAHKKPPKPPV